MEECLQFSVSPLSDTESAFLDDKGNRIGRLPGIVLEKAFRLADGRFLVITTEDCPFEEGFHISLVDQDGSLLETAHRVIPYAPGIITELEAESDDSIRMVLHDGETLLITVTPDGSRNPAKYIQQRFRSHNGIFGKHYLEVDLISESTSQ